MSHAVSVFEFSDHVRLAQQSAHLLERLHPTRRVVLYLREDCRDLVTSTALAREIRYCNKYSMMVRFFLQGAVLGRKVLVATGPEAAAPSVKSAFARTLRLLRQRMSIFLIVRDLKPDRGEYLLDRSLYSRRSVLAVESDALRLACIAAGRAPDGYVFPTPITHPSATHPPGTPAGNARPLTLLLTGSLDACRRDYATLFEALEMLRQKGVDVRVIDGGHCMHESAPELLERLRRACASVVASKLLGEEALDAALLEADALVCLNRPEFYGGTKGSGAIGDSFFAGKRLLVTAELAGQGSADADFYVPFDGGAALAAHLERARTDARHLRLPLEQLTRQTAQFTRFFEEWLKL